MPTSRRIIWRGRTLRILALGFAGFGLAYVVRAPQMAALTGIVLPTPTASIDFAATYGGAQLGLAMFLGFCARERPRYRLGLLAGGWTLAGIGAVRLVGLVLARGAAAPVLYVGLAIELLGGRAGVSDGRPRRGRFTPTPRPHRSTRCCDHERPPPLVRAQGPSGCLHPRRRGHPVRHPGPPSARRAGLPRVLAGGAQLHDRPPALP